MTRSITCKFFVLFTVCSSSFAQQITEKPLKIQHAEPLYIDLIRDLGAHKGEREWNVGTALVDRGQYNSYEMLVEYEWAVKDRWGLEVELPVTLYKLNTLGEGMEKPANRIESLKMATQYTFLVSDKLQTSIAVGSIVEWELADLNKLSARNAFEGVLLNPFLIAAKRWGDCFHSLVYTGPRLNKHFNDSHWYFAYEINTNVHYMLPGSRNFLGLEVNQLLSKYNSNTVFRPQMRVAISESTMIGIVPGIPLHRRQERMSAFVRFIYEPGHRHHLVKQASL